MTMAKTIVSAFVLLFAVARTFIAFLATGYYGYVTPMNLMAAGGYEPQSFRFA